MVTSLNKTSKAELLLLLITLIWGSTFVITKNSLEYASPSLFMFFRFGLAALLFALLFWKQINFKTFNISWAGWLISVLFFLGFAFQTIGLTYTTASHSGFITGLLVILTPVFQVLIEKKMPKRGTWYGIVLVTIGLFLLVNPGGYVSNEMMIGDALTFLCAVAFALYIVYLDIASKRDNIFALTWVQFVVVAVGSLFYALLFEDIKLIPQPELWGSILYLSIFATLLATFIQTRYQKDTTPAKAAVIFTMDPVFSAILAFFLLNELLGWVGILGGTIIVSGLLTSELSKT